jgi:hypothetical protein
MKSVARDSRRLKPILKYLQNLQNISFPISLPFFGVLRFEMFFFLGDCDVEGGVVFGVGIGVVLRSMVWCLSNGYRKLDRGYGCWHQRSRGGRLDHGCHGRGSAAASLEAVTQPE